MTFPTVVKSLGPDDQKKIESMSALSDPYDLSPERHALLLPLDLNVVYLWSYRTI